MPLFTSPSLHASITELKNSLRVTYLYKVSCSHWPRHKGISPHFPYRSILMYRTSSSMKSDRSGTKQFELTQAPKAFAVFS